MSELHVAIEAEKIFSFFGFPVTNSFLCTLSLSLLFILFAFWYKKQDLKKKPSRGKLIIDMILEGLLSFFKDVAGPKTYEFFPLLGTFFFFIIFANWFGLLPGMGSIGLDVIHENEKHFIPFFRGPTADLNTTLALALITAFMAQFYGFKHLGVKAYLSKFFNFSNPLYTFVGFLELISEFSRIISYAFRLFGNIFAGEVLLAVMGYLIPFLAPLPFLGLEVFVGFIQALVFTMLSLVFWSIATEHHDSNHEEKDEVEILKKNDSFSEENINKENLAFSK
ncbi:ATP synthase F0 subunit A [Candidatus Beckwithbacteria bacterium CG10_big_fil_rev_8_21_14_0_10_34_10]|uniref:ATP synthase subunit a n=1 Tax=Candidatus Beckwithbacteria bacterium CG10_big_fil_rev_8_21_14_0_10_34_10 TaxID=1974495 RepID=A0A2H0W953_9BACT|nr:MAG: ATP synthase F0 subunit A [Candidatus Beckwithbacteria bacterium CG10_big_fil_rev_8_21_14_0_10_34_10]